MMAANELEVQLVEDSNGEEVVVPSEDAIPEHKSGVEVDPDPIAQSGRFEKRDKVHMSIIQSGARTKGTFTVLKSRLHSSKAYYEYQLVDSDGRAYKNGAWIREKDLKMDKRG